MTTQTTDRTTAKPIRLNGAELVPDMSGAVYWPARGTIVVADLHLEKGSAFASTGQLLPPYDSRTTLRKLAGVLDRYRPRRVISLGDSFHDQTAACRLSDQEVGVLKGLIDGTEWIWVAGNHDPAPPKTLGGSIVADVVDGPLQFRHEAGAGKPTGEVSGHFHPKATVKTRMRHISGQCFVFDGHRLILPSFGAFTGGLSVRDAAIKTLFPNGFDFALLGRNGVHRFPGSAALARRTDTIAQS